MIAFFWRGHGGLVAVFMTVAFIAALGISSGLGTLEKPSPINGVVFAGCFAAAGAALWVIARRIEARPGRVMIDKETGREVTFGAGAGSFMFIPTRYCAILLVVIGLLVGWVMAS